MTGFSVIVMVCAYVALLMSLNNHPLLVTIFAYTLLGSLVAAPAAGMASAYMGRARRATRARFRRLAEDEARRLGPRRPQPRPDNGAATHPRTPAPAARQEQRCVKNPRDAERIAAEWVRHFGFTDAKVTPTGPDGGVDVVSRDTVSQVKYWERPVGRPCLQQLHGVASHAQKQALFFSRNGYTDPARRFANQVDMALFILDSRGEVRPFNPAAKDIWRAGPLAQPTAAR